MGQIKTHTKKILGQARKIGKRHIDLLTALLSIPVLISVIILNYNNLTNLKSNKNASLSPTPTPNEKQFIIVPSQSNSAVSPAPTSATCIKDIGPVKISYPQEGQTINDNPLCIVINYSDTNYCSVVWSYRINNGSWSDFTSNNPCIYNLPNGKVTFDLRVQSTVIQKETDLTRSFTYEGTVISPPATSSAATQ